jgi:hypothetical protein
VASLIESACCFAARSSSATSAARFLVFKAAFDNGIMSESSSLSAMLALLYNE